MVLKDIHFSVQINARHDGAPLALANLSVPTTTIFDGSDLLVAESGWANTALPRIIRIKPDWTMSVIASEALHDPITGLLVKDGQLFVSHRGLMQGGGSQRARGIRDDRTPDRNRCGCRAGSGPGSYTPGPPAAQQGRV
jgi:hypothetical protein